MSQVKVFQFDIRPELSGLSLKEAVYLFLTEVRNVKISKREVKSLIDSGKVHYNSGRCYKASVIVKLRDKILVETPIQFLKHKLDDIEVSFQLSENEVVYRDQDIIVVNKPSGISTGPSLDPKRDHLYAAVKRYVQAENQKKEIYVGMHHRLDVDTSGLVLFTLRRSANKGVAELFNSRSLHKTYLAISHTENKNVALSWEVQNHLGRAKGSEEKKELRICSVKSGGDFAHTCFRQLDVQALVSKHEIQFPDSWDLSVFENKKWTLFEARPLTGRTHQIRVHLFESGYPILGDRFYSAEKEDFSTRLLLHAFQLNFNHPVTGQELELRAPFRIS